MFLRTEIIEQTLLAGKCIEMSMLENKTSLLWQQFMPSYKKIHPLDNNLYSVEIYPDGFFNKYDPSRMFEKWAAARVESLSQSNDLKMLELPAGLYAVFLHKGPADKAVQTYQYIFGEWLNSSSYRIDDRPHFAIMGPDYSNFSEDSREEIFIPVI